MEWFHGYVRALERTLQEAPEVLAAVGVDLPIDIALCMIDDLVDVIGIQSIVREQFVSVDLGPTAYVGAHLGLQRVLPVVFNNRHADSAVSVLAVAREQAHDRNLAHATGPLDDSLPSADV